MSPRCANQSLGSSTTTLMPMQSAAKENRMLGRYARNVRRHAGRIRSRAIRRSWPSAAANPWRGAAVLATCSRETPA